MCTQYYFSQFHPKVTDWGLGSHMFHICKGSVVADNLRCYIKFVYKIQVWPTWLKFSQKGRNVVVVSIGAFIIKITAKTEYWFNTTMQSQQCTLVWVAASQRIQNNKGLIKRTNRKIYWFSIPCLHKTHRTFKLCWDIVNSGKTNNSMFAGYLLTTKYLCTLYYNVFVLDMIFWKNTNFKFSTYEEYGIF